MADYGKYEQYGSQREMLQMAINKDTIEVVPEFFYRKSKEERSFVNSIKSAHKQSIIAHGLNPKKHMNPPS